MITAIYLGNGNIQVNINGLVSILDETAANELMDAVDNALLALEEDEYNNTPRG